MSKNEINLNTKTNRTNLLQNIKFIPSICEENNFIIFKNNKLFSYDKFFISEAELNINCDFNEGILNCINKELEEKFIECSVKEDIVGLLNASLITDYQKEKELLDKINKIDVNGELLIDIEFEKNVLQNLSDVINNFDDSYHKYPSFVIDKDKMYLQFQIDRILFNEKIISKNLMDKEYNISIPYEAISRLKKIDYMKITVTKNDSLHGYIVCLYMNNNIMNNTIKYLILGDKNIF